MVYPGRTRVQQFKRFFEKCTKSKEDYCTSNNPMTCWLGQREEWENFLYLEWDYHLLSPGASAQAGSRYMASSGPYLFMRQELKLRLYMTPALLALKKQLSDKLRNEHYLRFSDMLPICVNSLCIFRYTYNCEFMCIW